MFCSAFKSILSRWSFFVFSDAFSLDPNTGLVRSRRRLQSSERFNLTVVATDQGRPPLWGTADLIITVIDVNDNRPVFVRPANGTIIHISEVAAFTCPYECYCWFVCMLFFFFGQGKMYTKAEILLLKITICYCRFNCSYTLLAMWCQFDYGTKGF